LISLLSFIQVNVLINTVFSLILARMGVNMIIGKSISIAMSAVNGSPDFM
jgi:5-bromo-4-chloroindolyl phosphate hydrolysis protein